MKHFHLFKRIALTCGLAAAASLVSSCSTPVSPVDKRANQLAESSNVTIYSYNDSSSPKHRLCTEAGPMPENVARALDMWLRSSTIKNFSYVYPQYYVAMTAPNGKQRVWGICTDGQANLVGILVPRDGVAAWDLPYIGAYKMFVCDTKDRRSLSDAIMTYLAEAGYDSYRIEARKASGLTEEKYLVSKPKTLFEIEQERQAAEAAEAAKKAAEAAAAAAAEAAASDEEEPSGDEEESTDEESTSEESTDEESSDEESTEEESSDEEESTSEEEEPAEEEEESTEEEE